MTELDLDLCYAIVGGALPTCTIDLDLGLVCTGDTGPFGRAS